MNNQEQKIYWGFDHEKQEDILKTPKEAFLIVSDTLEKITNTLKDCNGDMFLSDYRSLLNLSERISWASKTLRDSEGGEA